MLRIIANGQDLDLYPQSEFYITKQVHDLNDLNTRNGDITKVLTIPRTGKNERILNAFYYEGQTRTAIEGISSVVMYDSIALIQNGLLYWSNLTPETIDINFFNANTELFNSLGEMLTDLDLSDYDFDFDASGCNAIKSNTTGVVYPRADWYNLEGSQLLSSFLGAAYKNVTDVNISGFFFYVATLINEIIEQAGFSVNVDDLNSSLYDNLAIACPVDDFANQEAASIVGRVENNAGQSITAGTTVLTFPTTVTTTGVTWSGSPLYKYTVAANSIVELTVYVVGTWSNPLSDSGQIELINGSTVIKTKVLTKAGGFAASFTVNSASDVSGDYFVQAVVTGSASISITASYFLINSSGASSDRGILVNEKMPELSQAEFLKGILAHQNIILKTNPLIKEVTLLSFNDIKNQPSQDWSDKLLLNYPITENNIIGSYGQTNSFNYADSDVQRVGFNGEYYFDDTRLEKYATVVELPFEPSDNTRRMATADNIPALLGGFDVDVKEPTDTISGTSGASTFTSNYAESLQIGDFINVGSDARRVLSITSTTAGTIAGTWSSTHTSANFTVLRFKPNQILKLCNIVASTDAAYITEGDISDTTYQTDLDAVFNTEMNFNSLIEENYSNIMAALNRPLILSASFIFDVYEFSVIDFFKPVYISKYGALFFINKINQYRPNKPVIVELIRL